MGRRESGRFYSSQTNRRDERTRAGRQAGRTGCRCDRESPTTYSTGPQPAASLGRADPKENVLRVRRFRPGIALTEAGDVDAGP